VLPQDVRHGTVLTFPLVTAPYCLKSLWMQASDDGRFALVDGYLSYTPPYIWNCFWHIRILRSLFALQGLVHAPIDVAADRQTAPATTRDLNLSAIVVYDSPQRDAAGRYIETVFAVQPQHLGTCTVFRIQPSHPAVPASSN
jgi:hypothetical protein